jgi:tetratricopeptide (TPR) repeat protein
VTCPVFLNCFKGEFAMSRMHKLLGSALVAWLSLANVGVSGDSTTADKAALCVGQPGGLPSTLAQWAEGARLFGGLGDFHRAVSTNSPQAQAYFDQGMRFLWAFNHDEATRSFAKAAELDAQCAMCWWGVSLTVGPNYNLPMMAQPRATVAWEALQQAEEHAAATAPVEQALIGALAKRYKGPEPLDPSNEGPILVAYAQAMKAVAERFPDDTDVQVMTAEAMMNINAWKLWSLDGAPAPGTEEILAILEKALAKDPPHPGANHYYIHAVEASPNPGKGVVMAERLPGMMPAAGHLEHMPAHIMQRVGRYEDAAEANRRGIAADLAYYAATKPLDYYVMYTAHNYQFLAFSAAMEGRKAETIEAARQSRALISDDMLLTTPGFDWYVAELYAAMVRFGMWEDILAEPAPNPKLVGLTGAYLYARATALAAKGRIEEAKVPLAELEKLASAEDAGHDRVKAALAVAVLTVQARMVLAENKPEEAIGILREAAEKEDRLAYSEPADWFFPVRHILGAVLIKTGRAGDAEVVYRDDLTRHPNNGWALYGLAQSLRTQGRDAEALAAQQQLDAAWKNADVTLVASAY